MIVSLWTIGIILGFCWFVFCTDEATSGTHTLQSFLPSGIFGESGSEASSALKAPKLKKVAAKPKKQHAAANKKKARPFTQQELDLIARFNLSNAVKVDAVSAAVEYLIKQQTQPNFTGLEGMNNTFNRQGGKFTNCANNPDCPVCNVSLSAILMDGLFVHNKEVSTAPYDYTCWSMRIRYHVAPACAEEELSRGVEPIHRWRWTLGAAEEGYCKMPDTSPYAVGKQHQKRRQMFNKQEKPMNPLPRKKDTTILFLGLSFLSEPFMAMGCLFGDQITGGKASLINPRLLNMNKKTKTNSNPEIINPYPFPFKPCTLPIEEIRANGGQCTGFERENIPDFFPPELHQGYRLPIQNFNSCTMDHAYMEFGHPSTTTGSLYDSPDMSGTIGSDKKRLGGRKGYFSGGRTGRKGNKNSLSMPADHRVLVNDDGSKTTICFVYTFVVEANVPVDSPLPCAIKSWTEIDVIISLLPYSDYVLYADRKNWKELAAYNSDRASKGHAIHEIHFLNVNNLYENILVQQLRKAYIVNNFNPVFEKEDFLAKFKKCGQGKESSADIHYRMPGLPDFAAQMWLSYVATGFDDEEDRKVFDVTKSNPHHVGMRYWL